MSLGWKTLVFNEETGSTRLYWRTPIDPSRIGPSLSIHVVLTPLASMLTASYVGPMHRTTVGYTLQQHVVISAVSAALVPHATHMLEEQRHEQRLHATSQLASNGLEMRDVCILLACGMLALCSELLEPRLQFELTLLLPALFYASLLRARADRVLLRCGKVLLLPCLLPLLA